MQQAAPQHPAIRPAWCAWHSRSAAPQEHLLLPLLPATARQCLRSSTRARMLQWVDCGMRGTAPATGSRLGLGGNMDLRQGAKVRLPCATHSLLQQTLRLALLDTGSVTRALCNENESCVVRKRSLSSS